MSIHSKRDLEIVLSRLKGFAEPSFEMEQYATPAHIAAEWVWNMALKSEVAGKVILDAACGPGILGIGLLLMGARKVYFVDKDEKAMEISRENYEKVKEIFQIGNADFIISDISLFDGEVDITVQNPPFGTKEAHIDKKFLEKSFSISSVVYSMHKYSTRKFVEAVSRDFGFRITETWRYEFPVKATFKFHEKPVKVIDVGLWRMQKE